MFANVELGSEDKDVEQKLSMGSLSETLTILFLEVVALDRNWGVKFEDDELKERVASVCFANSTLSIFEDVEVVGSLIEAETLKDSDGNEECEDSEDDVEQ